MRRWIASLLRRRGDPRFLALTDQIVVSGCNFGTTIVVARTLTTEGFGFFSLASMVCLFFANLHRAGLTQPLNVIGSGEDRAALNRRLASLLRAQVWILPLVALAIAAVAPVFFPDAALTAATIAYFSGFALQETLRRFWYTSGEIGEALRNDLLAYALQLAVLATLAGMGALQARTAFLSMAACSSLAFVAGRRRVGVSGFDRSHAAWPVLVEHWPLAKWLLLTVLALWGAGQAYPLLMVPLGAAAVAAFAACRTLLNAVGFVIQSVNNYIPTQAATRLRKEGTKAFARSLIRTCALALLGGLAFVGFITYFAQELLAILYAGRYDHSAPILRILVWGTACSYLGAILGAHSLAMQDTRSSFLSNAGASVVTFTLGIWLIDAHGILGAAIGAALSLATAMSLQAIFVAVRLRSLDRKALS